MQMQQNNLPLGTLYNHHPSSSQDYMDSNAQESNGFNPIQLVYPDASSLPSPPPTSPLGIKESGIKNLAFPMLPIFPNPMSNDPSKLRQLMESSSDSFRQNVWFPPFNMFPSFMMPDPNAPLSQTPTSVPSNNNNSTSATVVDAQAYFTMPSLNMISPQATMTNNTIMPPMSSSPIIQKTGRLYFCTRPNCSKVYKNANGLKYHLMKGSCEWDYETSTPSPIASPPTVPQNVKLVHRPYTCKVHGCGKKYKNLNGLKYHAKNSHPQLDFKLDVKLLRGIPDN